MAKIYTKDETDEKKLLIEETISEKRNSQYTIKELKAILTDMDVTKAEWQAALDAAVAAGVKE